MLSAARADHQRRWNAASTRAAHRAGLKTYSPNEVYSILGLGTPEALAASLEPRENALQQWPLVAFYLQRRDGRVCLLRDRVTELYLTAAAERTASLELAARGS